MGSMLPYIDIYIYSIHGSYGLCLGNAFRKKAPSNTPNTQQPAHFILATWAHREGVRDLIHLKFCVASHWLQKNTSVPQFWRMPTSGSQYIVEMCSFSLALVSHLFRSFSSLNLISLEPSPCWQASQDYMSFAPTIQRSRSLFALTFLLLTLGVIWGCMLDEQGPQLVSSAPWLNPCLGLKKSSLWKSN
jgi:hypothetical protein